MDNPAEPVKRMDATPASTTKSTLRHLLMALGAVLAFVLMGGLLAALVIHLQVSETQLLHWQAITAGIKRWGLILQALMLAALILRWQAAVAWARRKEIVKPHEYAQVLGLRWHAALIGIAYLILVPIGPATLWRFLVG